jgi:predicted peptidase
MEYEKVYRSLNCLVSVPPGDVPEGGWPVLIFLHGDGEAAPMKLQNAMKMHGPLRESSGTKATERFVVVAPQLPAHKRGDAWATQAEAVRDIGLDVVGEHDCNAAQIYLTGFSFGGNGVLEIGVGQPNDWAALWPVDPTRPLQKSTDRPIWVSGGPRARPSKETFRKVWEVQDRVPDANPHPTRVYDEDLRLDHVGTAVAAYADDAIYTWLLTHRRPSSSGPVRPVSGNEPKV